MSPRRTESRDNMVRLVKILNLGTAITTVKNTFGNTWHGPANLGAVCVYETEKKETVVLIGRGNGNGYSPRVTIVFPDSLEAKVDTVLNEIKNRRKR